MKKLLKKRYIITALLVATISVSSLVMAHKMKQPNFERLADKLELSVEQTPEFIAVMDAHHEKRQEFKQAQRDMRKKQMEVYQQQVLSDLSAVLDAKQLSAFEQHMQKRKAKFEERRKKYQKEN